MGNVDYSQWRVLVADDEPDSIEVVRVVLAAAGATVYEASNGRAALEIFYQERPTMVLADLSMPDIDGWEMVKTIRAGGDEGQAPIIALTAHAMVGDKERVLEAGFDGYMSKPLKMFSFLQDLTICLENMEGK